VKAKQQFLVKYEHEIRTPMMHFGFTKSVAETDLSAKQERISDIHKMSGDA